MGDTAGVPDNLAKYCWYGLVGYVIGAELYLGLTDHEFLTTAFHEWRNDPIKKWVVISIWAFTTKHLFFRDFLPKLDPYGLLADGITEIKLKMNSRRLNGN